MNNIGSGSSDAPTYEFKIEYPKRKSENKELNQDLSDFTPPPEELFDCYVRSDTE